MKAVMFTPNASTGGGCTHPSHTGFAHAISADIVRVPTLPNIPVRGSVVGDVVRNWRVDPPTADLYLYEYADVYHMMPHVSRIAPEALHIPLATHLVFGLSQFDYERLRSDIPYRVDRTLAERLFRLYLTRYADGIIAVSELVAAYLRTWLPGYRPITVCEPYIDPELQPRLEDVTPGLGENTAVIVCENREHKGVDLLVDAWSRVREVIPDAELKLAGKGHPVRYGDEPGVTNLGYVESLPAMFEGASLYIHPARVDAFGVSVVEALAAGVPTIVSDTTGARVVAEELGSTFVTPPEPVSIANSIVEYFEKGVSEREEFSTTARELSRVYNKMDRTDHFRNEFNEMVSALRTLL